MLFGDLLVVFIYVPRLLFVNWNVSKPRVTQSMFIVSSVTVTIIIVLDNEVLGSFFSTFRINKTKTH